MKKYTGEIALVFNTLIWGGTFALIKNALTDISPTLFVGLRFGLATLIFLPFVYKHLCNANKQTLIAGSVLGLFYFSGFVTQTFGLSLTTATKSGFITGIFIIFIPVLQFFIEKRIPKWFNILGVGFVLVGLVMLSSKGNNVFEFFRQIGSDFNIGDLFTLICALLFAFQVVYVDIFTKKYDYLPMVFMQLLITALGGIFFSIILSSSGIETIKFTINLNVVGAILYTSIFASIIATIVQLKYQKMVSPTKAGIIFSIEPIFSAVFAYFLLSEKISNFGLIGCVLIFFGLIASEVFSRSDE